jgi:hypothetical protein
MPETPQIIRAIGLALNACHNTIATDDVKATPKADYSWRIDHSKEIAMLSELEQKLAANTSINTTSFYIKD